MSKKRQTTGLPKAAPKPKVEAVSPEKGRRGTGADKPLREFRSRAEREAEIQRYVLIGTVVAVAAVVVLVGLALIVDGLINPRRTVATAYGENISVTEFQERVRLERFLGNQQLVNIANQYVTFGIASDINDALNQMFDPQSQFYNEQVVGLYQELTTPDLIGIRVLNEVLDEKIIRRQAEQLGVTVTEEDIQAEIDQFFGFDREAIEALEEATPEATAEATGDATAEATDALTEATEQAEVTEQPAAAAEATETVESRPDMMPDADATAEAGLAGTSQPLPTVTTTPTPRVFVSPTPSPTREPTATVEFTATASPTRTITPTPPATLTAQEQREEYEVQVDDFYGQIRDVTGLSNAAIDEYFETRALRTALRDAIVESDGTGVYANVRHILISQDTVGAEQIANDVLGAINSGESFAELARTLSDDPGSGANGGELGWSPIFRFDDAFEEAVATAEIGAIEGPVLSQFGYHIIQVRDRETRIFTEEEFEQLKDINFQTWLEETRETEETAENISINGDVWADFVPTDPPLFFG
jgi:parvulin-like peptidyl-prolyl isomerase